MDIRWRLQLLVFVLIIFVACQPDVEVEDPADFEMPARPTGLSEARVDFVADGDTLQLTDGRRVRLLGINTPEQNQPLADEAVDYLRRLIDGKDIALELDQEPLDQFDRTLAYIWLDDRLINLDLLLKGYATIYILPPNNRYESVFRNAELTARNAGIGLWEGGAKHVQIVNLNYDAPGPDDENPNGEWVELKNISDSTINLRGYTLRDQSSVNIYSFGNVQLAAGQNVRIYSGCGTDSVSELYWCNDGAIWNNSGDTATLRDTQNGFVATFSYTD